ncbi:MAG: hypothetical protein K1X67_21435 [Fimbriimonadaceae bacterium]|nr:hypothetical protein [Fimbriimonadaceae bacterium]
MLAVLTTLLLAPDYRIAYSARYYSKSGAKTYAQVYVADITGKQRKAITRARTDCGAVRWTDASTLAWVQENGEKSELWVAPLGGKAKKLKTAGSIYAMQSVDRDQTGGAVYSIDNQSYTLNGSSLKVLPAMGKPEQQVLTFSGPEGAKLVIDRSKGNFDWTATFTKEGKSLVTQHSEDNVNFVRAYPQQPDGSVYVVTFSGNSTTGGAWMVDSVDWSTGKLITVASGTDLDFRLSRDLWASVTPRDLSPLGKGEVWTSQAYVGSRKTGAKASLGSGLVYFTSISLR